MRSHRGMSGDVVIYCGDVRGEFWRQRARLEEGRQILLERGIVNEWKLRGGVLDKEIERIVHRHLRDELDLDRELLHPVWKDESRIPVREGILLPVDEMF